MNIKCNCGKKIDIEKIKRNEPIKVVCSSCGNEMVINDTKLLYIKYIAFLLFDGFLMLCTIIFVINTIINLNFNWRNVLFSAGLVLFLCTCWKHKATLRIAGSTIIILYFVFTMPRYSNPSDFKIYNYTQNEVTIIGNNISFFARVVSIPPKIQRMKVTAIGDHAFDSCSHVTNITIPKSVKSIGEYAFFNCTSLTSITIPTRVTSIGKAAFARCTSLTSITIPASVTVMGESAFSGWTNTQTINVPFANAEATPEGWDANWNKNCNAIIKYWNGTTWE